MGAGETSTDEKTSKNSANVQNSILAPKRPLQLKIQIFEFKIWISSFFLHYYLKHYIYEASAEYGRRGGLQRRENVKTVQNSAKQCKTAFWPLLLAVIFEILNSKMLVLCSTHSQHIRKHISNNFPHLHNVSRGLETSTIREKQTVRCLLVLCEFLVRFFRFLLV